VRFLGPSLAKDALRQDRDVGEGETVKIWNEIMKIRRSFLLFFSKKNRTYQYSFPGEVFRAIGRKFTFFVLKRKFGRRELKKHYTLRVKDDGEK